MFLKSSSVIIRPLEIDDAAFFYDWSVDRDVTQFCQSGYAYPQSKSDISKWLADINSCSKTITLGITCVASGKLIGYTGIAGISTLNRCGEYFILIGDKEYWGRGLATEVTKLVTHYGFNVLGLYRIELTAFKDNPAAVRAYEKVGYVHEGVSRGAGFRNGEFLDKVRMSVLSHEWSGVK